MTTELETLQLLIVLIIPLIIITFTQIINRKIPKLSLKMTLSFLTSLSISFFHIIIPLQFIPELDYLLIGYAVLNISISILLGVPE